MATKRKPNGRAKAPRATAPSPPRTPREMLSAQGMSMTTLADLTGLDLSYISRLFNDQRTPSLKTTKRIAQAMGVGFEELAQAFTRPGARPAQAQEPVQV